MKKQRYMVAGYNVQPESPNSIESCAVIGYTDSIEGAEQLLASGVKVGWKVVKIIDTETQMWVEPSTSKTQEDSRGPELDCYADTQGSH